MTPEQELASALTRLKADLDRIDREYARSLAKHSRFFFVLECFIFVINVGCAVVCIVNVMPLGLLNVAAAVHLWHTARVNLARYRELKHFLTDNPRSTP